MRATERSDHRLEVLRQRLIRFLPSINREIELGRSGVDTLLAEFIEWVSRIDELRSFREFEAREFRLAIQLLGLGVSSLERHYQALRLPPGMALALVPHCEDLLTQLGKAGHQMRQVERILALSGRRNPA